MNIGAQKHILKKQIDRGIFPHAYLFSGSDEREKEEAIYYVLESLLGEEFMRHPDYFCLDKDPITIEDIRSLRRRVFQAPLAGQKNVFLVRRMETLSRDAQPVLLKLLEDPPASAYFLATTLERRLILPTIQSRFSHLVFLEYGKEKSTVDMLKIKRMPYAERFLVASEIAKKGTLGFLVADAIFDVRKEARDVVIDTVKENVSDFGKIIDTWSRLLRIHSLQEDPTVNKRLLAEYFMMVI